MLSAAPQKRILYIEAQAGQGKTSLALQFLKHIQADFAWYGLDAGDEDPVTLIGNLFHTLAAGFPALRQSILMRMISDGGLFANESRRMAFLLIDAFKLVPPGKCYIILDDLHLLEKATGSLKFLRHFVEGAPKHLRFVILSRHATDFSTDPCSTLYLDNLDLAFSAEEIAALFDQYLGRPLLPEAVHAIAGATEGWALGATLIAQSLENVAYDAVPAVLDGLTDKRRGDLLDYFGNIILSALPEDLRQALLKLALLETIPLELAEKLSPGTNISKELERMVRRNLFLHRKDDGRSVFVFHHLCHAYLRGQAKQHLNRRMQHQVLTQAGKWFLDQDRPEQGLWYYLHAQDFVQAEKIMRRVGPQLLAANRTVTLKNVLDRMPEEVIGSFGWLSYFKGVSLFSLAPPKARRYLDSARQIFIAAEDELGELLSSTWLITYFMGIECRFPQGERFLPRSMALYQNLAHQLAPPARLQAANAIAQGLCYFQAEWKSAEQYVAEAYEVAKEKDLNDALAGVATTEGFLWAFQGNWRTVTQIIENCLPLLQDPRVSGFYKLALLMLQANLAVLSGDFDIYGYHKDIIHQVAEPDLAEETIVGPYLNILDAVAALAEGDEQTVLESVRRGLAATGAAATPHLRSQYFAYMAYAQAILGAAVEAEQAADMAERLRNEAGGRFYEMVNQLLLGGVYAHTGQTGKALRYLDAAMENSQSLDESFVRGGIHAHRAFLMLKMGEEGATLDELRFALHYLKQSGYVHCFGWHPLVMTKVLGAAVKHGIHSDYARFLAEERLGVALTVEGEAVPLLYLLTLGPPEILVDRGKRIDFAELTPTQRELMALLAAAPGHRMSQEQIQAVFWPESAPKKARSAFDSLLSRLRKTLDDKLGIPSARHYLVLEKGLLRLRNCRIDADRFAAAVKRGRAHFRHKEAWQSANAFYAAHRLYKGEYMADVFLRDQAGAFRDHLMCQYLDSAQIRIDLLISFGRTAEAIQVAEKGLRFEPTQEGLTKTLYQLCIKSDQPAKARQVLKNYRQALDREGSTRQEIEDVMDAFWNPPDKNSHQHHLKK